MYRFLSYTILLFIIYPQSSAFAEKKITRSCTGKYVLHVKSASERYGGPIAQPEMHSFTAKGRCGRSVPNRCRQRARAAALVCMEFHLNSDYQTTYNQGKPPYYCSSHKKIYDYNILNLRSKIKQTACDATPYASVREADKKPNVFNIKVKVIARVYGKKDCAADEVLKRPDNQYPEWTGFDCPNP